MILRSAAFSFFHGVAVENPQELATAWSTRPKYSPRKPGPGGDGAAVDRQLVVADDQLGVDLEAGAEPVAALAGAVGGVEGEVPGRQLVERQAAVGAGQVLGERERLALDSSSPSLRATISTSATPSARRSAVSSESVRRRSMPGRRTSRSTTTSMVCCS